MMAMVAMGDMTTKMVMEEMMAMVVIGRLWQ